MVTMQFPLNGVINDGKVHTIEPVEMYEKKVGDTWLLILRHRIRDFDAESRTTVELDSLILVDDNFNYSCIKQDVNSDYYIDKYGFNKTEEEILKEEFNDNNIHIYLGENIDIDNYIRSNGTSINKKEYIPVLDSNIGESQFIGNAYELTDVFGKIELTKTPTYEEKDKLVEQGSYGTAVDAETGIASSFFSIDVNDNTFGHIFAYDSNSNMKDIEVLLVPTKHNYEVIYGTFKHPMDYKFARLSNQITFEGDPNNHVDADFINIENYDKKFYLADGNIYVASTNKNKRKK